MKRILWIAFYVILSFFIVIQFFRPEYNRSENATGTEIDRVLDVPVNVAGILKNACYDCHSNNTRYPWYMEIQPMGWLMSSHVRDGKAELNFSEFGAISARKQKAKLRMMKESIETGSMPLKSYTLLHPGSKLSEKEKQVLISWIESR